MVCGYDDDNNDDSLEIYRVKNMNLTDFISLCFVNICDYDTNMKMYLNLLKSLFPYIHASSHKCIHSSLQTRFVQ